MKKGMMLVVAVVALLVTLMPTFAYAQSTGLGITPRRDVTVSPGEAKQDTLYISNLNRKSPLTVTLRIVDFKSANETGTAALQLDEDRPPTAWSLKPFITIPESVNLAPGEATHITYTIKVPKNQGAGSYYSAIQYSIKSADDPEKVVINASGATLVFLTVPGKATELMDLKKFGPYVIKEGQTNGDYKHWFVASPPAKFAYLLENRGNIAENPSGNIVIKDIFGRQIKAVEDINANSNLALINQTRRFETCVNPETKSVKNSFNGQIIKVQICKTPHLSPGIYTANLTLFYGINGSATQEIHATAMFWYMPWWFIVCILMLIGILAFIIWLVRQKIAARAKANPANRHENKYQ